MKRILIMLIPFMLIGCDSGPPEWKQKGCYDSYNWAAASQLGFSDCNTFGKYQGSGFYDVSDWKNQANLDQWKDANKAGFNSKSEWKASKEGGFFNRNAYLRAKELGIKTLLELIEYDKNEMKFSGLRTAGAYYAGNEMCQEISQYLYPTTGNYSDQRMLISFIDLFRLKNISDMLEINPLNNEESKAFKYAKSNEIGDFYNQLSVNATNQKWLMDYLTNNCSPRIIQICSISRAKKDRAVVKICDDLSAYGL